jgi:SAM-dependent methyltransferase
MQCGVCGNTSFTVRKVLWDKLISEWQLSVAEVDYINRQQGQSCDKCGSNLRSIALANVLRAFFGTKAFLMEIVTSLADKNLSILEINEAGLLTPVLSRFKRYTFGAYPEIDMHALPYDDKSFDIVIHSDTLEHIKDPIHALIECHRVLKPGGALCFTVPVIVGRLSRNRDGLTRSYHGNASNMADDFVVHTEFGADAWTYVMEAGFEEISIQSVDYPAALAFLARRTRA